MMSRDRNLTAEVAGLEDEYEIIAELGRGGSAIVYRARDRALGRDVAIKVVRGHNVRVDDEQLARLAREARTVAQLDHPRIVTVYAVRPLPDGLALIMQWIPGRTLKQRIIEEGPLPVSLAIDVLRDVAGALGAAHARGIIHRDVKPENIFLDAQRHVAMLSDFGIAVSTESDTRLTMTGTAIGTPTYMAPELLDGGQPTPRSDVYALGLVAWEMLTGSQPWAGESLYGVIFRQKQDMLPAIDEYRADVPHTVQYVIERALQKRPAARWAGGDGMLAQLEGSVLPADWPAWQAARARRLAAREDPGERRAGTATSASGGRARHGATDTQATRRFRRDEPSSPVAPGGATGGDAEPSPAPSSIAASTSDPHVLSDAPAGTPADPDAPDWVIEDAALAQEYEEESAVARGVWPWAAAIAIMLALGLTFSGVLDVPRRTRASPAMAVGSGADVRTDERTTPLPLLGTAANDSRASAPELSAIPDSALRDSVAEGRLDEWPDEVDARPLPPPAVTAPAMKAGETGVSSAASRAPSRAPSRASSRASSRSSARTVAALPPEVAAPRVTVTGALSLAAGGRHSCVIARSRVLCWGANEDGQLGDGDVAAEQSPVPVRSDLTFESVSAGFAHTCGIVRGGALYCWGNGDAGQLGDATTTSRTAPVRVATTLTFAVVRAGRDHTCAVTDAGALACWGRNNRGQLGDGTTVGRSSPVMVPSALRFRALAVGGMHSCALDSYGAAYCWGANDAGQLGDGSVQSRPQPVAVASSIRFVDIAAGSAHTCAVSMARDVWCWGRSSGVVRTAPARVAGPSRVESVTAGTVHSCARSDEGAVWCWGSNEYGQLGNGGVGGAAGPQRVQGRRFDAVVANGAHTCALSGSEVWCWGYNADGQTGAGDRQSGGSAVPRPTRVNGTTGGGS